MNNACEETHAISAIRNGTVIDHIPAGQGMRIFKLLNLEKYDQCVMMGLNLPSHVIGKKDLIKLEGHEITEEESSYIAIFAPTTTIAIIRDEDVIKKFRVSLPEMIQNVIVCPNPQCVTNHEQTTRQYFVGYAGKKIYLRCQYCERTYAQEEINEYEV